MAITLQSAQQAFPKAFKGPYAQMHEKLIKELAYHGTFNKNINGIRNGIAVIESPYKENFETTVVRGIYTLDDKGNLILLKKKAIYHRKPVANDPDRRSLSAKWSYFPKTGEIENISSVALDGKMLSKEVVREANGTNNVAGQFYWLPSGKMKYFEKYNYQNGTYDKVIKDTTGSRGVYGEHGRLDRVEGSTIPVKVKEGSFTYNENLGGVVTVQKPKDDRRLWSFFSMLENVYHNGIKEAVAQRVK